jgi:hypothetical protein
MADKLSGWDKFQAAHRDEKYWERMTEVYRAENAAMKESIRVVGQFWDELEKDGSWSSARGILLNNRFDPLLLAVKHMRAVAKA